MSLVDLTISLWQDAKNIIFFCFSAIFHSENALTRCVEIAKMQEHKSWTQAQLNGIFSDIAIELPLANKTSSTHANWTQSGGGCDETWRRFAICKRNLVGESRVRHNGIRKCRCKQRSSLLAALQAGQCDFCVIFDRGVSACH